MMRRLCVCLLLATAACSKGKKSPSPEPQPEAVAGGKLPAPEVKAPEKAPARGPEHAVYSLLDNRLSAHLGRGGAMVVPAGSAGFAKYLRFGNTMKRPTLPWALKQRSGELSVARMTGKTGSVYLPLTAAQAATQTVWIRANAAREQAFTMQVGDQKLNGTLAAGWSTVSVPTGALLKEGENGVTLFAGDAGIEVEWIAVGAAAPPDGSLRFYDATAKALLLPDGGSMTWYVMIPDKGLVTGNLSDGACQVSVQATADDGTSAEGALRGLGSAVDLAALGGKAARLELSAKGCAQAQLADAALVVPGEEAKVTRGEPPAHIVFIIMDSLRADRVRAFHPKARPEAPTFDKLAETSTLFRTTFVQGNESRVSHSSIWTALYPINHGNLGEKDKLDPKWVTIDEVAKAARMHVAGVSGNGYIRPSKGYGTAWDQFSNHIEEELGLKGQDLFDKGLGWVGAKKEPWFLYLGTIDTHVSWRAKKPWIEQYDPGYKGRFEDTFSGEDAAKAATGKITLTEREKDHVRAIYDSNVSYQDDLLRQLIEKLTAAGVWDKTMLIITADHGDEQWEDGKVGHGASSRNQLVHVPLLIHYPPLFPAGSVHEGAEVIDITPTLADALGVAADPQWQGTSLLPIAHGVGRGGQRLAMSSMYEGSHSGRIGSWKVRIPGSGKPEVYNLAADEAELQDLYGQASSAIGARLILDPLWILRQWNREWKKSQWGNAANVSGRFAADLGE
ncbi:MAG: sulfatase-like hydrolase/transferase [Myxococcales bacterium]|nr:sulfatase-like hydrolase/transferase [Myxococcales bacterium]